MVLDSEYWSILPTSWTTPTSIAKLKLKTLIRCPRCLTLALRFVTLILWTLEVTQIYPRLHFRILVATAHLTIRTLRISTLALSMITQPHDNAGSTSRRRPEEQLAQVLDDVQDAVEQALCDADLRISRTRFYDAFRIIGADPTVFFPEEFTHWESDVPFLARVLL
jgi:hypothetical protein